MLSSFRYLGLSPRGRGNHNRPIQTDTGLGSIPAWAGQPKPELREPSRKRVYPRVGGATLSPAVDAAAPGGLSPRGRGNRIWVEIHHPHLRSIPAWAGQPAARRANRGKSRVYPRVGGATPWNLVEFEYAEGLSPRGRGNLRDCPEWPRVAGSIPAWAGQPRLPLPTSSGAGVYPRVGGATTHPRPKANCGKGLSPRGRGNLGNSAPPRPLVRSIPAWAGQPATRSTPSPPREVYPRVGGATLYELHFDLAL